MIHRLVKLVKREWASVAFKKEIEIELPRPIVSFTFDDVPACGFENGGGILTWHGFAGTFYVSLKFLDASDKEERFTTQHLSNAIETHHELGCHTNGHIHLARTPLEHAIQDLNKNRQEMQAILPQARLNNFSYPFGEQTLAIKKHLGHTCRSARGVGPGINCGQTDLLNLKAIRLYETQFPLGEIFQKLDEVEKRNGWLIFYTHDVKNNPTPWGCSPEYFEAVVNETVRRNLAVLTMDAALDFLGVKHPDFQP